MWTVINNAYMLVIDYGPMGNIIPEESMIYILLLFRGNSTQEKTTLTGSTRKERYVIV